MSNPVGLSVDSAGNGDSESNSPANTPVGESEVSPPRSPISDISSESNALEKERPSGEQEDVEGGSDIESLLAGIDEVSGEFEQEVSKVASKEKKEAEAIESFLRWQEAVELARKKISAMTKAYRDTLPEHRTEAMAEHLTRAREILANLETRGEEGEIAEGRRLFGARREEEARSEEARREEELEARRKRVIKRAEEVETFRDGYWEVLELAVQSGFLKKAPAGKVETGKDYIPFFSLKLHKGKPNEIIYYVDKEHLGWKKSNDGRRKRRVIKHERVASVFEAIHEMRQRASKQINELNKERKERERKAKEAREERERKAKEAREEKEKEVLGAIASAIRKYGESNVAVYSPQGHPELAVILYLAKNKSDQAGWRVYYTGGDNPNIIGETSAIFIPVNEKTKFGALNESGEEQGNRLLEDYFTPKQKRKGERPRKQDRAGRRYSSTRIGGTSPRNRQRKREGGLGRVVSEQEHIEPASASIGEVLEAQRLERLANRLNESYARLSGKYGEANVHLILDTREGLADYGVIMVRETPNEAPRHWKIVMTGPKMEKYVGGTYDDDEEMADENRATTKRFKYIKGLIDDERNQGTSGSDNPGSGENESPIV